VTVTERKRGISIYRAAEAADLDDTDFMTPPEMGQSAPAVDSDVASGAADGSAIKVLARDAGGFSLVHAWFKAHFPLPRHSHNADCMYYVISGAAVMGSQTLRAGDSFFVPADAPYGYTAGPEGVEVLEVRHGVEQFDIKLKGDGSDRVKLGEAILAHRDEWAATKVSPTFEANAG
jgi:quercetin dioxygenase-like cupin family protein